MAKISLNNKIKQLEAEIITWQGRAWKADDDLVKVNARLKEIAAENESLRIDKKWLQSIISPLAQAIHTRS